MNTITSTDKNLLQTDIAKDPIKSLAGKVIGTATKDNMTIRGRLIKCDDNEIWLEKISGDIVMIARTDITRIWISRDCSKKGSQ
jgi:hypothetical protein